MSNPSYVGSKIPFEALNKRVLLVCIIGTTLLGFYLRYKCLGCLGFRWDEDLTSLAVKALLETGVPELPSGMIYTRFYPYQWVIAASVKLFGFSEFSMRLPAVLFGTILIPATYLMTKKVLNEQVALIVAAGIALSFWQVEMARTARMYAPFFLIYLVAAYTIFCAYFKNDERVFSPWVLPIALLALSIHQLAYSLAIMIVLAIPLRKSMARTVSLLLQAGGIGIAFIAIKSVQERYFYLARTANEPSDILQSIGNEPGPLTALLDQVSQPNIDLLSQVYSAYPITLLAFFAIVLWPALLVIRAAWRHGLVYRTLTVAAAILSLVHQFNVVAIVLAMMLIALKGGVREVKNPAWYWPAFYCISIFFLWLLVITILNAYPPPEIEIAAHGFRKLLRALVDYPNFRLFWSYIMERPLLSLPLALGTLWGMDKISRGRPDATALFLVGSFWCVLFVNGILETKFEFFRYSLHLDVFYLMLVVIGLFAIPDLLTKYGISLPASLRKYFAGQNLTVIIAIVTIAGVNPIAASLTSTRDYRETAFPYPLLGLDEYDDFASPAKYVRDRLQDDDIILVLDPREYWNYIGRVDFWLWSNNDESQTYQKGGRPHDLYVGVPVLHSSDEVKAVLASRNSRNAWILFSKARLDRTRWISEDLKLYLNSLDDRIVYVGRDEQTVVIKIAD